MKRKFIHSVLVSALIITVFFLVATISVQGKQSVQKVNSNSKVLAQRATLTPRPSPFFRITVKNSQGAAQNLTGSTVCSGTWQGQVAAGKVSTSNCVSSPSSSFTIPADIYRSLGNFTGVFFKLASGWTMQSVTSDTFGGFANTIATDERGASGPVYGWASTSIVPGEVRNINVTVQLPISYGYIVQGNNITRVSYYQGQPVTTACQSPTAITTCTSTPVFAPSNQVGQCVIGNTGYAIFTTASCPAAPTATRTPTPTATRTPTPVPPTATPTTKPGDPTACPADCSLNVWGDANCDTVIDAVDAGIWTSKYLGEKRGDYVNFNTDFNKDGKTSLLDFQVWVQGFYKKPTPTGAKCADGDGKPISPTPPAGCFYQQVQCIQAPCPPQLICPTATPGGPTGTNPTDIPEPTEVPVPTNTPGPSPTAIPVSGVTYYISPSGNDSNNGTTLSTPFKTFAKALPILKPGDLLYMREGVYAENVKSVKTNPGTAAAKITVKNYGTERPVIQGLFWMSGASHWVFDGINITWGTGLGSGDHMVKFTGNSEGWILKNCEIWGARSYAGISITGFTKNWNINNCVIHDTYKSNDTNQDHLIYANDASFGVIENNIFVNSENGRGVKLGPPSSGGAGPNNIIVRYNTFYNNTGPANIQVSGGTSNNTFERNIMVKPQAGKTNITVNSGYNGTNSVAKNNIGWESSGVFESGIVDGGGNVSNINPQINFNISKRSDGSYILDANSFRPINAQAQGYGKYGNSAQP